ncbi:MAG: hypothetical protein B7X65_19040 [Polaromonas sp. 39-63-25]|nr:MAG: hypothetical protein B7Y60_03895 [Polaromonas sp. 35-63-35]OYZ17467.1 MAG: hypothetical protein B7Y28_19345 [Polaromonas sp. 16-63-31]OYZ76722.1 MAG: hypothetical protein B7Y09_19285 [Polaromonas sp. 24-63-21]OZA47880.1 MAG: hypothetical protein B7X88_20400 [Polaromonas sp. 17-63-33]OZA85996.1 MAG: hypothetical protein B7X65_19040 [Polaromonas sp. 39-63-25]
MRPISRPSSAPESAWPARWRSDCGDSSDQQGPRIWLCQSAGAAAPPGGRALHAVSNRGGMPTAAGSGRDWAPDAAAPAASR